MPIHQILAIVSFAIAIWALKKGLENSNWNWEEVKRKLLPSEEDF